MSTRLVLYMVAVCYVGASVLVAAAVGSYEEISAAARSLGPWAVGAATVYGVPHVRRWIADDGCDT